MLQYKRTNCQQYHPFSKWPVGRRTSMIGRYLQLFSRWFCPEWRASEDQRAVQLAYLQPLGLSASNKDPTVIGLLCWPRDSNLHLSRHRHRSHNPLSYTPPWWWKRVAASPSPGCRRYCTVKRAALGPLAEAGCLLWGLAGCSAAPGLTFYPSSPHKMSHNPEREACPHCSGQEEPAGLPSALLRWAARWDYFKSMGY